MASRFVRGTLATVLGVAFTLTLLVNGYSSSVIGRDGRIHPPAPTDAVPDSVLEGGCVVDARGAAVRTYHAPPKTIVLSFDDGPDPTWTPQILAVLQRHHVPATFFVVGEMTARYPEIVRQELAQGDEVGIHTFTHPDLENQPAWRIDLELSQSQLALAGAAGINSSLVRMPYSSEVSALDNLSWPVVQRLGKQDYLVAFVDTDSEDWARPGVARTVANAVPPNGQGSVVLMHDAGGDRSQTVAALDLFITTMQRRGYRFDTLTGALGAASADHRADANELRLGRLFIWSIQGAGTGVLVLVNLLALVGVLTLARTLLMLILAGRQRRAARKARRRLPAVTDPVTVLVPAYNEHRCIEATLRSLRGSDHPIEIIVIDDGSTDGTAATAEALGLPGVRVVRQQNAGKAAALNRGIALARHELIAMVDADTVFEPGSIRRLVQPFADPAVGAVAGNAKVGNRRNVIALWQHIEYVIGFNLDRRMYEVLRCMPTVPGAIGAFRRSALVDVGGMSSDTLAEDTDVTMALQRSGWRVVYAEDARAFTEAPSSLGQLYRQRYRWSYGTMQSIWKHRRAVVESGPSGRFGRFGLPMAALFQILLPLLAPLIDVFTIYGIAFISPLRTAVAWLALLAVQALCALYAFWLDRERPWPLLLLPIQQILYRQLMYLVLMQAVVSALSGRRLRWHKLQRVGGLGLPDQPSGTGALRAGQLR
ncbi:glycosyltransferase [Dactylosporangium sp. NPDC051484]|uniref:bifunctional polysaccharide deacetylase/glycosyltransferase family 2 protein n=1 Tax=Dactylosporangium sp. NPDC051484 TaxID=3154942 RepID=UPI003450C4F8